MMSKKVSRSALRASLLPLGLLTLGLLTLGLLTRGALAQQKAPAVGREVKAPEGWVLERDVEYGRAGDRALVLDMMRPEQPAKQPLPMIAFIHGGGWRNGNKSG
ncbi:MAG TPA: hypothetical protein VHY20_07150, partial [Pirellulales bacterium]|nr:hypothetical protein [Pirellulales bacterium]